MRFAALGLGIVAALLLALSGFGTRFGVWPYQTGFVLLRSAAYIGLAAAALAIIALAWPRFRAGIPLLVLAFFLGAVSAYIPWQHQSRARSVPRIHDISTDTENPPQFVAVVPRRAGAPNPPAYDGAQTAELQKKAYPDIQPLTIAVPPETGFARSLAAAEAMGWEIVAADAKAGRIEATATTLWFGFKDDVVIRVGPAVGGSRIDVRSKSRVGRSDTGTNAQRIRAFLERVR